MENKNIKSTQPNQMRSQLIDRIDVLESLLIFVDEIRGNLIDEITYFRIKSGIDFILYEFKQLLDYRLDRPISMDDESAKTIADMAKISKVDSKDIIIKRGIDLEVEYICSFVDNIVGSPTKILTSKEMVEFVTNQNNINKEIEKLFNR